MLPRNSKGFPVAGIMIDSFVELGDGGVDVVLLVEDYTEIGLSVAVVGFDSDGVAVFSNGLSEGC